LLFHDPDPSFPYNSLKIMRHKLKGMWESL
jgi:hypothetical protein